MKLNFVEGVAGIYMEYITKAGAFNEIPKFGRFGFQPFRLLFSRNINDKSIIDGVSFNVD